MTLRQVTSEMVNSLSWTKRELFILNVKNKNEIAASKDVFVNEEGRLFWKTEKNTYPLYFSVPEWKVKN